MNRLRTSIWLVAITGLVVFASVGETQSAVAAGFSCNSSVSSSLDATRPQLDLQPPDRGGKAAEEPFRQLRPVPNHWRRYVGRH
jgi:hypothetical protein